MPVSKNHKMADTPSLLRTNAARLFNNFHLKDMAAFKSTLWYTVSRSWGGWSEEFQWFSPLVEEMRAMNLASADLGTCTLGLSHEVFASLMAIAVVLMSMPSFSLVTIDAKRPSGEQVDVIKPLFGMLEWTFPNHDLFMNPNVIELPKSEGRIFQDGHPDFQRMVSCGGVRLSFVMDVPSML